MKEYNSPEEFKKDMHPDCLNGPIHHLDESIIMSSHHKLWDFAKQYKPKKYLEIGSQHGFSAACVAVASSETKLYLFDWPGGGNGGWFDTAQYLEHHMKQFAPGRHTLFYGNTLEENMRNTIIANGPYDLIFVDGDHSYDGARYDFETVKRCMSKSCILVMDDTSNVGHAEGLTRLYHELAQEFKAFGDLKTEIIKLDNPRDVGFGYFMLNMDKTDV